MAKPDPVPPVVASLLAEAERAAWDAAVASATGATLSCWFRWKMGVDVDLKAVVAQAVAIADAVIVERRKRCS